MCPSTNINIRTCQATVPEIIRSTETIVHPGQYDILCHSSRKAFNHIGNRRFRVIVENHASSYAKIELKAERSFMRRSIVKTIEGTGGRFLRNNTSGTWEKMVSIQSKEEQVWRALRTIVAPKKSRSVYDAIYRHKEAIEKRRRESSESLKKQLHDVNLDTTKVSLSSMGGGVSIWCDDAEQADEETFDAMECHNAVGDNEASEDEIRQHGYLCLAARQRLQLRKQHSKFLSVMNSQVNPAAGQQETHVKQAEEEAVGGIRRDDRIEDHASAMNDRLADQAFAMNTEFRNAAGSDEAQEDKIRRLVDLRASAVQLLQRRKQHMKFSSVVHSQLTTGAARQRETYTEQADKKEAVHTTRQVNRLENKALAKNDRIENQASAMNDRLADQAFAMYAEFRNAAGSDKATEDKIRQLVDLRSASVLLLQRRKQHLKFLSTHNSCAATRVALTYSFGIQQTFKNNY